MRRKEKKPAPAPKGQQEAAEKIRQLLMLRSSTPWVVEQGPRGREDRLLISVPVDQLHYDGTMRKHDRDELTRLMGMECGEYGILVLPDRWTEMIERAEGHYDWFKATDVEEYLESLKIPGVSLRGLSKWIANRCRQAT